MATFHVLLSKISFNGDTRIKRGDIVDIKPTTHVFSDAEKAQYIIVPVTGVTENEIAALTFPLFSDGGNSLDMTATPPLPTLVSKRKYHVKTADISSRIAGWNEASATNTGIIYQPFLDNNIIIAIKSINFIFNKYTNAYQRTF